MISSRGTTGSNLYRTTCGRLTRPATKRGLMMLGGWTSTVDYWAEDTTATVEGRYITQELCDYTARGSTGPLAASCATDSLWGNVTMRARITDVVGHLQTIGYFQNGRVDLHGSSMGGLSALLWAMANPTLVGKISLVLPVVDVQQVYDDDPILFIAASIDAAYGGRPSDADNPNKNTSTLSQFPIKIWASETDTVTPIAVTEAFAAATGAEIESIGSVGHTFGGNTVYRGNAIAEYHGI